MDMTGLDNILSQIELEAKQAEAQILEKADAACTEILAQAESACKEIEAEGSRAAADAQRDILDRSESGSQMQRKNRILAAKQEMIAQVIVKAQDKLLAMPGSDYFVLLLKWVRKYVQSGDGILSLSASDIARMPAYFPGKLAEIAEEKGGTLVVSDKPAAISGGFILAYGGIEENCSFEALFEAEKERLQDAVRAKLFS